MFETDYKSLGLTYASPFDVLKPRPPEIAQKKKKVLIKRTRYEHALISLESPEQRKERQAAERQKRTDQILRKNSYSDVARSTDADKTGRIVGRRNGARSA